MFSVSNWPPCSSLRYLFLALYQLNKLPLLLVARNCLQNNIITCLASSIPFSTPSSRLSSSPVLRLYTLSFCQSVVYPDMCVSVLDITDSLVYNLALSNTSSTRLNNRELKWAKFYQHAITKVDTEHLK